MGIKTRQDSSMLAAYGYEVLKEGAAASLLFAGIGAVELPDDGGQEASVSMHPSRSVLTTVVVRKQKCLNVSFFVFVLVAKS